MSKNFWTLIAALVLGVCGGFLLNRLPTSLRVQAQNAINPAQSNQILVRGNGRAVSRLAPPGEQISLIPSNTPQRSFTVVPAGKKFILTDVVYQPQASVHQPVTVNLGNANLSAGRHDILFQFTVEPMKSDQVHLCSGYTIPAGNSLVAWTGHGPEPEQFVSISVTGYLVDQ
jgi:hypothetical protein